MLRQIRIRNLAVIESAEVDFEPGFNVLTGETGAGKSILVEAVGLLLGGRASADLVRTGEGEASIEALFDDSTSELVVRREITSQGRSRAYVNGALATASAVRELAARFVEIHGQHQHQSLLDPATHLPLLDAYEGLGGKAHEVAEAWTRVAGLREQLDRAGMDGRERAARLELVSFQLAEIERIAPRPGEDDELSHARQVLASADRLKRLCDEGYDALYDDERSVLGVLAAVRKRLDELAGVEPAFAQYVTDARDVGARLEDLAYFLRDYGQRLETSPARLQEVEDRLASIERLKRKSGPTLADVIERGRSLARERDELAVTGERAEEVRAALDRAAVVYLERARDLSAARRAAAPRFSREMEGLLRDLAMAETRFDVRFDPREPGPEAWDARGIDVAEFFLSPNPGEDLRPLARIASGGELSRVMLGLKTLGARRTTRADGAAGRTLIFDEVDAGIGGRVADVVGERLRDLGRSFQVLCITHLPQIAARGTTQFRIAKAVRKGRTATSVERLDDAARVEELARMMGGATVTASGLDGARELLERGRLPGAHGAKSESESRRGAKAKEGSG